MSIGQDIVRSAILVWALVFNLIFPQALFGGPAPDLLGVQAEALSDDEMGEVRGGYAGFYFAFDFSGYWDNTGGWGGTGKADGSVTYSTPVGDVDVVVNGSEGPATGTASMPFSSQNTLMTGDRVVTMRAFVGEINQTQGVIQICQVPGSNNVVTTVMNLELTVINISDPAQLVQLPSILPGLVGY